MDEKPNTTRDAAAEAYDLIYTKMKSEPNAYKRAVFRAGWDAAEAALADTLARRVEVLEGALRFYGDVSKYPAPLTGGQGSLYFDCGQIARAAMTPTQPKEPRT